MMLEQSKNIFFLGIKGVAMANLAVILKKMGKDVGGCDISEEFITDKLLSDNKIDWQVGFEPKSLPEAVDLFVYSAAHGGLGNPIAQTAKQKGIRVISQAHLMGEIIGQFQNKIAVCGCHGKTTTSSLLVYALNKLKQRPSYMVGVPFFSGFQGGDFQDDKYFVIEADEYGVNPPTDKTPKFHLLNPDNIIATNIDFDHPDVYKNIVETKSAFKHFFQKSNAKIFACADDDNLMTVIKDLPENVVQTYGYDENSKYRIKDWRIDETGSSFKIDGFQYRISLYGEKNISNAAGVVALLLDRGFNPKEISQSLIGFNGAERRFEKIYEKNDSWLFDDYAHHPSEILATINAAKNRFPDKRIIVIFQPHTFSRTNFLLNEFRSSLAMATIGYVLPIFASAREKSGLFKIDSHDIVNGLPNLKFVQSNDQLLDNLKETFRRGDVIFTMGAGDVYKLKEQIIKLINQGSIRQLAGKNPNNKSNFKNLKIEKNKDLKQFNTLRKSVTAEYFLEAKSRKDLIEGKKFALENNLALFILAGGSNLALMNNIQGLVIKNNYQDFKIIEEDSQDALVSVSSGYPVSLLVNETVKRGLEGFEYQMGLPGTAGGAIYMNSKWTRPVSYFSDRLVYANLIDGSGKIKKAAKDYFDFEYDFSILQVTKEVILEAVFKLNKTDPAVLKERAQSAFNYRKKTQPMGVKTSGCYFKNVDGRSAGQMIDQAGLKGFSVGGFFVSPIHANFIINQGNGQTKDLEELVRIIKSKVKAKFGVELKEEVIVV